MPAYNVTTPKPAAAIYPGDSQAVWSAETITTGSKSVEVAIAPSFTGVGSTYSIAFDITFSGTPGAFTITPQTSNTDVDGDYVNLLGGAMNSVAGSSGNTCNYQAQVSARFARLVMTTQPANAVTVTASISR